MPRDPSGNYTLPAGNPVSSGELVESNWANTTMDDLSAEMTDSLSRSGKGGFTAPTGFVDKSGSVPGINFVNEPTSGFKRETTGDVRVQVQGNDKMRWTAAGDAEVRRSGTFYPVAVEPADRKVMYGEGGVTVLWHYGITAAPGWAIEEPDANIRNLVIGPAAGGGVIGGLEDPTDNTYNLTTTVSISGSTNAVNVPHTHGAGSLGTGTPSATQVVSITGGVPVGAGTHTHGITGDTGSDNANHSHPVSLTGGSGSGTLQIQPRYARGLLMKLDA